MSNQTDRYDVAIVGGGVAGSALGGSLAAAGLGVAIVEAEPVFRDRVRGEGIHPWGVAEAIRLGIWPALVAAGVHPLPIWQEYADRQPLEPYRWADDAIDGHSEHAISHPTMQQSLLDWAASHGATVLRPARAVRLESGPVVTVTMAGAERSLAARLVVGADGRRSTVGRWIGATTLSDPVHHRFGGVLLDRVDLDPSAGHDAFFPGGRVFVLPQGRGIARAYIVISNQRFQQSGLARAPQAAIDLCAEQFPAGSLTRATAIGPLAFFPNGDLWADRLIGDDLALVGDAASANDPSVGQGLSIAFRDARELRDALLGESDWNQAIAEFACRRQRYSSVLRAHAQWLGILVTDEGEEADERRERVAAAREKDPGAGGFAAIFGRGPDGLVADESARSRFFGIDA